MMVPGGLNPKQMKVMMKRMGVKMDEIDAEKVIIKCAGKDIVIENPQVVKTTVSGQEMFQVSGEVREERGSMEMSKESEVEVSEEDVKMVADQAKVSEDDALKALEESKGDIAAAIMALKGK